MFERHLYYSLLVVLLTFAQLPPAPGFQQPKSRDALVKESIAKLDSSDIHVAAQAATDLGLLRATEAVPAMLRVLRSSRFLSTTEDSLKGKNGMSIWVTTDVRAAIITSLGLIADPRAVPVLKMYLKKPLTNREVFTGNVAHALYQITGKSFEYKDYDGVQKLYEPSPITEEEVRTRFRPDLKATAGLTASLEITEQEHGLTTKTYWLGDRPLVLNIAIRNQSRRIIEIDASVNNFLFSSVAGSGVRTNTPASLLPPPEPSKKTAVLKPGQEFRLRWFVETLKESPLSNGWTGYVNLKCVYTNPRRNEAGATWRGEQLVSNSVERYYYPTSEQALEVLSP